MAALTRSARPAPAARAGLSHVVPVAARAGFPRDVPVAALAALFAVALIVRFVHFAGVSQTPYFHYPIIDARTYHLAALQIAAGLGHPDRVFWQPPGYPCMLGAVYAVAGSGPWAPRVLQALMGALSVLLTAGIGARLFGRRVGIVAAACAAFYPLLFYFDGELLPPTPATLCLLAALALALRAGEAARPVRWWAAAGLAGGVASLFLATSALVVAVIAAFARRRAPVVLLAAALAVAPATIRNAVKGGEFVPISSNGGINFYIGNNAHYDSTVNIRPDRHWDRMVREPREFGILSASGQSAYFTRKGFAFLGADPAGFAMLQLKKLRLLLGGNEVLRNHSIYPFREASPLLAALLWKVPGLAFPWGLLAPLALVGVCARWRAAPLAAAALLAIAASVVAFFVTARYRVPMVPLMLVFAVEGVRWFVREAAGRARLLAAAGAVAALLGANLGQGPMPARMNPDAEYNVALGLGDAGQLQQAILLCRSALEQDPDSEEGWVNLGIFEARRGAVPEAEMCFRNALELEPSDPDALGNLAALRAETGRIDEAAWHCRRALALSPGHKGAGTTLAMVLSAMGVTGTDADTGVTPVHPTAGQLASWRAESASRPDDRVLIGRLLAGYELGGTPGEALAVARQALTRLPRDFTLRFALGRLLVNSGDAAGGAAELRRALALGGPLARSWIARNPELAAVRDAILTN
ncbi:MAG: glycosyltransferase family 39 protein [Candidatus Eisenbacteria bacterium]|nr:glycosyltransferase family 39 protein [Candidatus Eisenbacteria bacterium]